MKILDRSCTRSATELGAFMRGDNVADAELWRSNDPRDIWQAIRNIGAAWKRPTPDVTPPDAEAYAREQKAKEVLACALTRPGFDDTPIKLNRVDNPSEVEIVAAFGAVLDLADRLGWPEPSYDQPSNGADWTVRRAYRAALAVAVAYCWTLAKREYRTGRTVRGGQIAPRNAEIRAASIVITQISWALAYDGSNPRRAGLGSVLLAGNIGLSYRQVADLVCRHHSTVQERERDDWARIQREFGPFCPTPPNREKACYTSYRWYVFSDLPIILEFRI